MLLFCSQLPESQICERAWDTWKSPVAVIHGSCSSGLCVMFITCFWVCIVRCRHELRSVNGELVAASFSFKWRHDLQVYLTLLSFRLESMLEASFNINPQKKIFQSSDFLFPHISDVLVSYSWSSGNESPVCALPDGLCWALCESVCVIGLYPPSRLITRTLLRALCSCWFRPSEFGVFGGLRLCLVSCGHAEPSWPRRSEAAKHVFALETCHAARAMK